MKKALVAAAVLIVLLVWYLSRAKPRPSLCIAVMPAEIGAPKADSTQDRYGERMLQLAGDSVELGITYALWSSRAAYPLDQDELVAIGSDDPATIGQAVGADEVITTTISADKDGFQAELARWVDGVEVWSDTATASTHLALVEAVADSIKDAYTGLDIKSVARSAVRQEDFVNYLELRRAFRDDPQSLVLEDVVDGVAVLCDSSPELYGAYELGVKVSAHLYQTTGNEEYLERAHGFLTALGSNVPPDAPGYLGSRVALALLTHDKAAAESALRAMASSLPEHPYIDIYRGRLLFLEGRCDEAVGALGNALLRRRSWETLWDLARTEILCGRPEAAVNHLEQALVLAPGRIEVKATLAEAAMYSCQLDRAAEILIDICGVEGEPRAVYLGNLAMVRLLQGRYAAALRRFELIAPGDPSLPWELVFTADCHFALGELTRAAELYRKAVSAVGENATPYDRALQAYALARVGELSRATATVAAAVEQAPDNLYVAYQAALVYQIAGDSVRALEMRRRAEERGYGACWFQEPWWVE